MGTKIRLLIVLMSLTVVTASLGWGQLYPADIQRILERKKIVVAMVAADYPPLFRKGEGGRLEGFDVGIAQDIAKKFGVDLEINRQSQTFDDAVEMVAKGEADLGISNLSINLPRAKMVYFSHPYLILRHALLINRLQLLTLSKEFSVPEISKTTATIGVLRESAYAPLARSIFPRAVLEEFDSFEDMVAAVVKGKVFAVFNNDLFLKRYLRMHPSAALILEIQVLEDLKDPIAIAVRPDSPHLLSWVNVYLNTQALSLSADELLNKFDKANTP